jgi:zinc finger BED domain-containing protein 5/7/8/9
MDKPSVIDMQRQFDTKLNELVSQKGQNIQFFTRASYADMIEKVKSCKRKVAHKKPEDYQRLRRFDIMNVGRTEKLIVPVKEDKIIKSFVHKDEIFAILHDTHLAIGHGGRNRMAKKLNLKYKNITREMIVTYLNLCETCEKKHIVQHNTDLATTKPVLRSELIGRSHVDVIDVDLQEDDPYKFILVYQDHCTKFVQLRPVKSKKAKEIANVLLDIFAIFGAPSILQSANGWEFINEVILELCNLWDMLKIVPGESIQGQNTTAYDSADHSVQHMLTSWLKENDTRQWSKGLPFVQLMKNAAHHAGMNCSPYEAMFGTKLKFGLKSTLPQEALAQINSEEDLKNYINNCNTMETAGDDTGMNEAGPSRPSKFAFVSVV